MIASFQQGIEIFDLHSQIALLQSLDRRTYRLSGKLFGSLKVFDLLFLPLVWSAITYHCLVRSFLLKSTLPKTPRVTGNVVLVTSTKSRHWVSYSSF